MAAFCWVIWSIWLTAVFDLGKACRLFAAGGGHGADMGGDFLDTGYDAGDRLAGLPDQTDTGTDLLAGGRYEGL